MPKFTKDELDQIRENAERLEAAKEKKIKKAKSPSKKTPKKHESSLQEKLIAPILLFIIVAVTYVVMILYSQG